MRVRSLSHAFQAGIGISVENSVSRNLGSKILRISPQYIYIVREKNNKKLKKI